MITEEQLEQLALQWFQETGWNYASGIDLAPEGAMSERVDFRAVVLKARLAAAVQRLNPQLMLSAVEEVVHMITTPTETSLTGKNRASHRLLIGGVKVEFTNAQGDKETDHAQLIDFKNLARKDFLVVSRFTVTGTKKPRRPDLVIFGNGLPLRIVELKNPADTNDRRGTRGRSFLPTAGLSNGIPLGYGRGQGSRGSSGESLDASAQARDEDKGSPSALERCVEAEAR